MPPAVAAETPADDDETVRPVDRHVANRVRLRRLQLGLNQRSLAKLMGVALTTIWKYETGVIQISARRLYELAQALQVEPTFFFDGYPDRETSQASQRAAATHEDPLDRREIRTLVHGYFAISDLTVRADILQLLNRMSRVMHQLEDKVA